MQVGLLNSTKRKFEEKFCSTYIVSDPHDFHAGFEIGFSVGTERHPSLFHINILIEKKAITILACTGGPITTTETFCTIRVYSVRGNMTRESRVVQANEAEMKQVWSSIYIFASSNQLGLTAAS